MTDPIEAATGADRAELMRCAVTLPPKDVRRIAEAAIKDYHEAGGTVSAPDWPYPWVERAGCDEGQRIMDKTHYNRLTPGLCRFIYRAMLAAAEGE